jgi:hypothetical protein
MRIGYDGIWYAAALGLSSTVGACTLPCFSALSLEKGRKKKGKKSQEILSSRFFVHGGYY